MKKLAALLTSLLLATGLLVVEAGVASAHTPLLALSCEGLVVNLANYTEDPGESHTVEHPAVPPVTETTPAVPGIWQNFSPDEPKKFEGEPSWPTDDRGTWQDHGQLPPGQEGPDGVYQSGNGPSSWFYRAAGTPEQVIIVTPGKDAWTETIIDREPNTTPNHVTVVLNGETLVDTAFGTSYYHTFPFPLDGTTSTYTVTVTAWDDPTGVKGYSVTRTGNFGPCGEPPLTEISVETAPSVVPATCAAAGVLVLPEQQNVTFTSVPEGTGPGTYVITATAADGFKLTGDVTWTRTVDPQVVGLACAGDQPAPKVDHRDVSNGADCETLTVITEHQTRTQEYVLDGSTWILGPWSPWVTTSTSVSDAGLDLCSMALTTSNEISCGTVTVTLRNHSPWLYRVLIETQDADGTWVRVAADEGNPNMAAPGVLVVDNRGDASNDQTASYTVTFPEDSGTHPVRYKVSSGAESDLYVGLPVGEYTTVSVESDCEAPPVVLVTPVIPAVAGYQCDPETGELIEARVILPGDANGIHYSRAGSLVVRAELTDPETTAFGQLPDGWTLDEGGVAVFVAHPGEVPECEIVTTSPETTPATTTVTETVSTTPAATTPPAPVVSTTVVQIEPTTVVRTTGSSVAPTTTSSQVVVSSTSAASPPASFSAAVSPVPPTVRQAAATDDGLATTGVNVGWMVLLAVILLMLGSAVVFLAARRGRRTS